MNESEFTELKNDCACNGHDRGRMDISCPECSSHNVDWDMNEGHYVCCNCHNKFITERFCND